jgi:hypothetical protein
VPPIPTDAGVAAPSGRLAGPVATAMDGYASSRAMPERRLLLAVLEEGVATYHRYVVATDPRGRGIFGDVAAWFASEDHERLYAFASICDALGINATYVRSGLGRSVARDRTPVHGPEQPLQRLSFRRVGGTRQRTTGRAEGSRHA